ncbi:hypothetical protein B566_EDAN017450 [Ephemera danica]|nr:hypothetical protein B566_EDAN017450 [Ephemera danica]
MELSGPLTTLLAGLSRLCNPDCGLTFAAQSLLTGEREGRLMLYQDKMYPYGAIEGESPSIVSLPPLTNHSPIWQPEIRDQVTDSKQPDYQLAKAREAVLVPGSKASSNDIKNAAKVPVMFCQWLGRGSSSRVGDATVAMHGDARRSSGGTEGAAVARSGSSVSV